MIETTATGIEGLDEILNGGIVRTSTALVSGSPGTGKSLLGLQFVYNGAKRLDENGIYLSFEENREDLRKAAESIGFDQWQDYVDEGRIKIYGKDVLIRKNDFNSSLDLLLNDLDEHNYTRLVLDSLTMFQLFFETEREKRTYLLKFIDMLRENGLTSLLIQEQETVFPETEIGLENFLTDGNIRLFQTPTETGVNRYLWVPKMRKQQIDTDIFPMEISEGGLKIHHTASSFTGINTEFPL